jgi:hypothetical protein
VLQALASNAIHAVATVPSDGLLHSAAMVAEGLGVNLVSRFQVGSANLDHGVSSHKLTAKNKPTVLSCDAHMDGKCGLGDNRELGLDDGDQALEQNALLQRLQHLEQLVVALQNDRLQSPAVSAAPAAPAATAVLQQRGLVDSSIEVYVIDIIICLNILLCLSCMSMLLFCPLFPVVIFFSFGL